MTPEDLDHLEPVAREATREPYAPGVAEWRDLYQMLCGFCERQLHCEITEAMIEMKTGGPWPEGGWVTDPGAEVTCLSYAPRVVKAMPRQQLRQMLRTPEGRLPPVCGGCAARRGSEASVSLHTRRDYAAAVRNRTSFVCHEDPSKARMCGGWCRAVRRKSSPPNPADHSADDRLSEAKECSLSNGSRDDLR